MMKQGNDVQILTDRIEGLPVEEKIDGAPVHRIRKGRFLFGCDELLKSLNGEDVDIINWHGSDTWSAVHLWRLRKKLRNDVIWTLHSGPLYVGDMKNLKFLEFFSLYKFWNNVLNALCPSFFVNKWAGTPQVKLITTLSKRLKEHLQSMGVGEEKIKVIRSGVDTKKFRQLAASDIDCEKRVMGFREKDAIIVYFGPLSPFRGANTIISAMPKISNRVPSAKLLLLARGFAGNSKETKLEKLMKRRKEIVLIPGVFEEKALIRYLAIADVIVLPFRFWPQVECPLTILEAMAMEKPLITTNVGAIPEIIDDGENGVLVSPGKPKVLAEAVIRLLTNKDLSMRIGKNALAYVRSFHDWDVITQQTLDAFQAVMQ
jgi:glycosyltransferase involved in cell wall biosynthesis